MHKHEVENHPEYAFKNKAYSKNLNLFEVWWIFSGGLLKKLPLSFCCILYTSSVSHGCYILFMWELCNVAFVVKCHRRFRGVCLASGSQIWLWMEKTVTLYTAIDNQPSFCFVLLLEKALWSAERPSVCFMCLITMCPGCSGVWAWVCALMWRQGGGCLHLCRRRWKVGESSKIKPQEQEWICALWGCVCTHATAYTHTPDNAG